jgi:DNA-binding IclR family transcriptional regulator
MPCAWPPCCRVEGALTVTEAAARLGVAPSTAHRLLAMLVYRDFAVQAADRRYLPGPVLQLPARPETGSARLREAALPHLRRLTAGLGESTNVIVRVDDAARFVASVEAAQALRVGNREGMVFPAHRVTGGLVLLAELTTAQLDELYARPGCLERAGPWLAAQPAARRVRQRGFALNQGHSERGVHAIGVLLRDPDGMPLGGVSASLPSVRYDSRRLPQLVESLQVTAAAIRRDLTPAAASPRTGDLP